MLVLPEAGWWWGWFPDAALRTLAGPLAPLCPRNEWACSGAAALLGTLPVQHTLTTWPPRALVPWLRFVTGLRVSLGTHAQFP